MIFFKRAKKVSEFETEVIQRLDCLLKAQANIRQDIRQIVREIVREELRNIVNERNRKAWWNIA